ncbi:hypothetical protein [Amycolatopsis sp. NPDC004079]|uniref:hypothetical protein n=1 Tax=Amycolatopsis sp. NPDC004079 TaxID=3154549 RepID=UPI0033AF5F40
MGSGEGVRTSVLAQLDTLVGKLREQSVEMGKGPYQSDESARIAALSTIWPVLEYLRGVMHVLVPEVDELAVEAVQRVLADSPAGRSLSEDERDELQERATVLLRDVLLVGQFGGVANPQTWSSLLPSLCVEALVEADALADLDEKAEEL